MVRAEAIRGYTIFDYSKNRATITEQQKKVKGEDTGQVPTCDMVRAPLGCHRLLDDLWQRNKTLVDDILGKSLVRA